MFFWCFFNLFFETYFWMFLKRFLSFFRFPSFRTNPRRHAFYCSRLVYNAFPPFQENTFFHERLLRKVSKSGFIFASKFHQFSWLFRYRFSHRFFHRFFIENGSKMALPRNTCGVTFSDLFATFSRPCLLCWFYVELGSLLAPFWLPLAPFWHPLAHFGRPSAPFWLTFGVPWLTFGALGLTFGAPVARCSHFWCLLASFFILVYIFEENRM